MDKIDLTAIDDWPAAVVAMVIVLAVLVWPGVMAWLNTRKVAHEMRPNSGGSLRDAVDRIEQTQTEHTTALAELTGRVSGLEDVVTSPGSED